MANRLLTSLGLLLIAEGLASAEPTIDPEDAIAPIAIVEGAGVKVAEGTVLHPQLGVEAGYNSNVFYTDQNTIGAGLIRVMGEVGTASLSPQRLGTTDSDVDSSAAAKADVGDFQYRADLRMSYDQYLSSNSQVTSQGGLGIGAYFRGIVHPNQPVQFAVVDSFQRLIRPTNFESNTNTDRDVNQLKLQLQYAPTGRSLSAILHYQNVIDAFESSNQQFANRFQNTLGLRVNWKILPQTLLYVDFSEGIYTGLGSSSQKVTSYPLLAVAGIETLLTPKITFWSRVGYTNGFYSTGPSYSAAVFNAWLSYHFTERDRIALLYSYNHNDSINANFYRDHDIRFNYEHPLAPFDFLAQAGLIFREYSGVIAAGPQTRDDTLGLVYGEIMYNFRDWLAASVSYQLLVDSTNYRYAPVAGQSVNPGYLQHEILLGIRAAY